MTTKTDTNGRPYVRVNEIKIGLKLEADGGFTCIREGTILTVDHDDDGFFVNCGGPDYSTGGNGTKDKPQIERHYLSGQLDDLEEVYIGLYNLSPT
jgi:hypothetical protein